MYTYRDLIRKYSDDVRKGHADRDLDAPTRRIAHVLLNLASNAGAAAVPYPPTEADRQRVARALGDIVWDARPLVIAAAPRGEATFGAALDRALDILRNL